MQADFERYAGEIQRGLEEDKQTYSAIIGQVTEAVMYDDPWPEIIPFDAPVDTEDFLLTSLPKPIADYSTAVCESLQVSAGMAGPLALGCLSTLFQRRYKIKAKEGWTEPLNLFVIVSARPSERKTPVFNALLYPFYEYEKEIAAEEKQLIEKNNSERRILEERLRRAEKSAAGNGEEAENSRLEAMSISERLTEFPHFYEKRLFTDDFTEEALTRLMHEQGGVITLASDEGGFLSNLKGRYKGTPDIDAILKAYPGTPITIDRIGRAPVRIENPRLTVMVCCQPSVLQDFLADDVFSGRGMTARFLYSRPKSLVGRRKTDTLPIPEQIKRAYHDFIIEKLEDTQTGTITLSRDAWELFEVSLQEIEGRFSEDMPATVEAWRGKYNGNMLRICGLLHSAISNDPVNEPVKASTMLAASSIMEYFNKQYDAISQSAAQSTQEKGARYILSKIKGRNSIQRAELTSICRTKLFENRTAMDDAIQLLIERGFVRQKVIDIGYKSRTRIEYEINPMYT